MYSGWPCHYNNVGYSARLKTSFELNPVTEGKQGTFHFPLDKCIMQHLSSPKLTFVILTDCIIHFNLIWDNS